MKKTNKKNKVKKVAKKAVKKCKKGFTLVELLVVVAIIGILAGIVVVSMTSSRQRVVRASLLSTMSSINSTATICVHQDGAVQPPANATTGGGPICDLSDFTEQWPALQDEVVAAHYQYDLNNIGDTIIQAETTAEVPVVTCTVGTTSCVFAPAP